MKFEQSNDWALPALRDRQYRVTDTVVLALWTQISAAEFPDRKWFGIIANDHETMKDFQEHLRTACKLDGFVKWDESHPDWGTLIAVLERDIEKVMEIISKELESWPK